MINDMRCSFGLKIQGLLPFSKWLILGIFRKNHKNTKKNITQKHKNVIAYITQDLSNNNLSSFIFKKNFTFIFRMSFFFAKCRYIIFPIFLMKDHMLSALIFCVSNVYFV